MASRLSQLPAWADWFLDPALSGKNAQKEARKLETEQKELKGKIDGLMAEWEKVEAELESAGVNA